ncbi:Si-specific NAD(P)(+) transhydrogenase [Candidatus Nitrospira salsa]
MTASRKFDLLCIGSGPAGQRAAVQAAKLGRKVAVIEKRRIVGGVCVDTGTIPSKTFREAILSLMPSMDLRVARQGFLEESVPTMEQLMARVGLIVQKESEVVESQLRRNGISVVHGSARFISDHSTIVNDLNQECLIEADHILIAVGTIPAPPPGKNPDGEWLVDSDGILQIKQIPRTMAVIGSGVIGIEYASMFSALGTEVTVIDKRERPLEFLDYEIIDELIHQMRNKNVVFRLGEAVEHFEVSSGTPRKVVIHLESGKRHVSDVALFSVGRLGATESLNLEAAGLAADIRGRLRVNKQFRTKVPHIFAAGDVIGHPGLAATSAEQGRLAACHAFGVDTESKLSHLPIGIYAIPEISMVGETERELTNLKVPYEVGMARYREIARGAILGDDSGLLKLLFHRYDQKLLGVHAIGTGATELIHIGQAVMGTGGGLSYFLNTVFNYPTLAECYKVAAYDAYNKLTQ